MPFHIRLSQQNVPLFAPLKEEVLSPNKKIPADQAGMTVLFGEASRPDGVDEVHPIKANIDARDDGEGGDASLDECEIHLICLFRINCPSRVFYRKRSGVHFREEENVRGVRTVGAGEVTIFLDHGDGELTSGWESSRFIVDDDSAFGLKGDCEVIRIKLVFAALGDGGKEI